jgi:hypothetical protein
MTRDELQVMCAAGQERLTATAYAEAEAILAEAEAVAWEQRDWDTLARLYMPLQETCGEGAVALNLIGDVDARQIVEKHPHGTLLIAGWGSIEPAKEARKLAAERELYLDVFLAAAYRVGRETVVVVTPTEEATLVGALVYGAEELANGTFSQAMGMWEKLHTPFLVAAEAERDPVRKIEAYRKTIRVDYACELAHQKLADVARNLARENRK